MIQLLKSFIMNIQLHNNVFRKSSLYFRRNFVEFADAACKIYLFQVIVIHSCYLTISMRHSFILFRNPGESEEPSTPYSTFCEQESRSTWSHKYNAAMLGGTTWHATRFHGHPRPLQNSQPRKVNFPIQYEYLYFHYLSCFASLRIATTHSAFLFMLVYIKTNSIMVKRETICELL